MKKESFGFVLLILSAMVLSMCGYVWAISWIYYRGFQPTVRAIAVIAACMALLSLLLFPSGGRSHPIGFASQVTAGMTATLILIEIVSEHIKRPLAPLTNAEFAALLIAFPMAFFFVAQSLAGSAHKS